MRMSELLSGENGHTRSDLVAKTDRSHSNISMELPAHGVSALLLNDAGPEPEEYDASCGFFYQCSVRLTHLSPI